MKPFIKIAAATLPMVACFLLACRFPDYGVFFGALGVVVYWAIIE